MPILFLDTFTGSAGALSSHAPDVGAGTWGAGSNVLNGSGAINPSSNDTGSSQQSSNTFTGPEGWAVDGGFVLSATITNNNTANTSRGSAIFLDGTQVLRFWTDAATPGDYIATIGNLGEDEPFDDYPVSQGEHVFDIFVYNTYIALYIDGVLVAERSRSTFGVFINSVIGVQQWSNGTDAQHAISRLGVASFNDSELEVFPFNPDWSEVVENVFTRETFDLDNESGVIDVTDVGGRTKISMTVPLKLFGRAQVFAFRGFLERCRGRAVSFLMPSYTNGIQPLGDISGVSFDAKFTGFLAAMPLPQTSRRRIRILFRNRSITPIDRDIVSVEDMGTYETYTVDASIPTTTLASIDRIMFMVPVRLDQDTVELFHPVDDEAAVSTKLAMVSVPDIWTVEEVGG